VVRRDHTCNGACIGDLTVQHRVVHFTHTYFVSTIT
jgi:hypothetical protein